MEQYIATFHTHLAALRTDRALKQLGVSSQMMPVPRRLSSSCGTCVAFQAETDQKSAMDTDLEALYRLTAPEGYELLCKND
ncbi:MAG: DUF3343 domain-containing protein [Oscillospiraceae bacterium]